MYIIYGRYEVYVFQAIRNINERQYVTYYTTAHALFYSSTILLFHYIIGSVEWELTSGVVITSVPRFDTWSEHYILLQNALTTVRTEALSSHNS